MSSKSKAPGTVPGTAGAKSATPSKRGAKTDVTPRAAKSPVAAPVAAGAAASKSGRNNAVRAKSKVEQTASPVETKRARKAKPGPGAAALTTAIGADTARPVRPRAKKARAARHKSPVSEARFSVGDVVRHKYYPFRGVIFDIDPVFANTDEWWQSIPEKMRPRKNQPFYHLLAENAETEYIAYVSEQNLLPDNSGVPVRHPQVAEYFVEDDEGRYRPVFMTMLN